MVWGGDGTFCDHHLLPLTVAVEGSGVWGGGERSWRRRQRRNEGELVGGLGNCFRTPNPAPGVYHVHLQGASEIVCRVADPSASLERVVDFARVVRDFLFRLDRRRVVGGVGRRDTDAIRAHDVVARDASGEVAADVGGVGAVVGTDEHVFGLARTVVTAAAGDGAGDHEDRSGAKRQEPGGRHATLLLQPRTLPMGWSGKRSTIFNASFTRPMVGCFVPCCFFSFLFELSLG